MPFAALDRIIVLFVASFGSAGFVFLTQTILVRLLSLAEYGQLVALLAFINLMTPVSLYGVGWLPERCHFTSRIGREASGRDIQCGISDYNRGASGAACDLYKIPARQGV
jgi:hypothetical protein